MCSRIHESRSIASGIAYGGPGRTVESVNRAKYLSQLRSLFDALVLRHSSTQRFPSFLTFSNRLRRFLSMFMREHSFLMRCFAVLALVVWSGAFHHDAWLGALGMDHPHNHHVVGVHSHSHHHDDHCHRGGQEHEDQDSIPCPDTQAEPVTSHFAKICINGPKPVPDSDPWHLTALRLLLSNLSGCENEHPPPEVSGDLNPPELILLAHSVQSNAPPFLS